MKYDRKKVVQRNTATNYFKAIFSGKGGLKMCFEKILNIYVLNNIQIR